jgi:hypothetical protein
VAHAAQNDKFQMLPKPELKEVLWFFAAWITMMLGLDPAAGRVPARAVGQGRGTPRQRSSILGGVLYFGFAFIPMFLAYSGLPHRPEDGRGRAQGGGDTQLILPT